MIPSLVCRKYIASHWLSTLRLIMDQGCWFQTLESRKVGNSGINMQFSSKQNKIFIFEGN